jgi:hypothetical protein
LKETYKKHFDKDYDSFEQLAIIGARKFGKKYKVPRVLVVKPYSNINDGNSEDEISLDVQPLFACVDPPHIEIQLNAMINAYHSLWRVYLFIHPAFHWNKIVNGEQIYVRLHEKVEDTFLKFINKETPIRWKNSVDFKKLLPNVPIDYVEFIEHYTGEEKIKIKTEKDDQKSLIESNDELQRLLNGLIDEVFSKVPKKDAILKQLKEKESEAFLNLVLSDPEMIKFIKVEKKKAILIEKLPLSYFQNENRGDDEAQYLYEHITKIMKDDKGLFK